jgi:hypothetical protein
MKTCVRALAKAVITPVPYFSYISSVLKTRNGEFLRGMSVKFLQKLAFRAARSSGDYFHRRRIAVLHAMAFSGVAK